ncbi:MAG TPA: type 1 glutamine amidotransferase domain-containing protein [Clostridia bacterium]|nr:type 1 glutamine amidotransferase domain-containing protein [Clostridia bacterium]
MSHHQHSLKGKKVAILVADGFEQVEMTEPRRYLEEADAQVVVISPNQREVRAWNEKDWGDTFRVDLSLGRAKADDFHGLMLPGGVMNPDTLRMNEEAVRFVKAFFLAAKPVAAICHGPWILIDAGVVKGRTVTSYPSLKADLANAGAKWMDQEVVVESGLVTSRRPGDLPAFCEAMVEAFGSEHYEMQKPMEAFQPVAPVH